MIPSIIRQMVCHHRRPLMPILALALSERNPPTPRAKRFIQPKMEAMAAADSVLSSNLREGEMD